MQYIDINHPRIIKARDEHYEFMRYLIKRKINGNDFKEKALFSKPRVNKLYGISNNLEIFLNNEDNLKKILIGTPKELDKVKDKFKSKKDIEKLKKLFNYDEWIKGKTTTIYKFYHAYHLAEKLDIPTCVYCNRMYTKTVIDSTRAKITRPAFDHWFPKGQYPLLGLSFYNLIPSCTVCNSGVKGSTPFELSTHFHPYHKEPAKSINYTFSYDHKNYSKFDFKIKTDVGDKFSADSVKAFELEEIFKAHEDEIEDLRSIRDAYSENYIEMVEKHILKTQLDRKDVYRLAFGVHYDEDKFDRRPLSKMKKDILKELGII